MAQRRVPRTTGDIAIGLAFGVAVGGVLVLGLTLHERRTRSEEPAV